MCSFTNFLHLYSKEIERQENPLMISQNERICLVFNKLLKKRKRNKKKIFLYLDIMKKVKNIKKKIKKKCEQ